MSSEALKNLSLALGMGGTNIKRQKEAFEYVIENSDKSQDELTEDILGKDKKFCYTLTKAARRIISHIVDGHRESSNEDLLKKWNDLFLQEERECFWEFHPAHKLLSRSAFNPPAEPVVYESLKTEAAFSVKVIRNAAIHYLIDVKPKLSSTALNSDELELLNKLSNMEVPLDLTQDELHDQQIWQEVYLKPRLYRDGH